MIENNIKQIHSDDINDFISLGELIAILWRGKIWIVSGFFIGTTLALILAILTPEKYRAEMILAPVSAEANDNLAANLGKLSGIASIAGIGSLTQGVDKTTINLEKLKSKQFCLQFVRAHALEIPLLSAKGWNAEENILIFDEKTYNSNTKKWKIISRVEENYPPKTIILEKFRETVSITQEKSSGIVRVSATFYSPFMAKEWLDLLAKDINDAIRLEDKLALENSIEFLNKKIQDTSVSDIRGIFYQLLEAQTKKLMLTNADENYAFALIDPPIVPEDKSSPKTLIWCLIGGITGLLIGLITWLTHWKLSQTKPDYA